MQLQKISTLTNLLNLNIFVHIQSSLLLCQPSFPNKQHTQTFLTLYINKPKMKNFDFMITQLSEVEIQQSSESM